MNDQIERLKANINGLKESQIFPCINDLIINGVSLSRFSDAEMKPSRQDATQYISAWFKYIGVQPTDYQEWFIKFCLKVLSSISSSSPSQIKHSTKSNMKYIHNSDIAFDCGCEDNIFKASCSKHCHIYNEMKKTVMERKNDSLDSLISETKGEVESAPQMVKSLQKKEKYNEQFMEAMNRAMDMSKKGIKKKFIVNSLNEIGYKTRTGKSWSLSTLNNELRRLEKAN